jgi:hypothetical protein
MSTSPQTYDVYLTTGARRFYIRNDNHGATLSDDSIGWNFDGRADTAAFADIVSVHLQSGGSWQNVIDQCSIGLADGTTITFSNGNASGLPDDRQAAIYRDFVRDLHRRLAARRDLTIRFTAGYGQGTHQAVTVCAVLLGLICVALPLVLVVVTGQMQALYLLIVGGALCWPLAKMVQNNAPRGYEPTQLPEELLG